MAKVGQKRTNPFEDAPGKAQQQEGGGPSAEDGWTCEKCGNLNFASRTFCNMRKCQAPGPWTCPTCGNKNFASRMVCNKRTCGRPRPGMPGQGAPMMGGGGGGANNMQVQQAVSTLLSAVPQLANINGVGQLLSQVTGGRPLGGKGGAPGGMGAAPMSNGMGGAPEGSWRCSSCGNINFPSRTTCNARNCGLPRDSVDGGPPPKPSGGLTPPEGSWVCRQCQNVNWPSRETCNKRGCGAPRVEADGGPPPRTEGRLAGGKGGPGLLGQGLSAGYQPAPPDGSWTCSACGNLNFASRTTCNMRKCQAPRF